MEKEEVTRSIALQLGHTREVALQRNDVLHNKIRV